MSDEKETGFVMNVDKGDGFYGLKLLVGKLNLMIFEFAMKEVEYSNLEVHFLAVLPRRNLNRA